MTVRFTRTQLSRALDIAGHPTITEGIYARPHHDPHRSYGSCLALDYDCPGDLGVFVAVVGNLLDADQAIDFGAAMRFGLPAHPDQDMPSGLGSAYWPGWVLDEPTGEEWADQVRDCGGCGDDETCPAHETAPWDTRPLADTVPAPRPARSPR